MATERVSASMVDAPRSFLPFSVFRHPAHILSLSPRLPPTPTPIPFPSPHTLSPLPSSYPDPANPTGPPRELIVKLLSQDPAYLDAPTEGIRRVLEAVTGEKVPRGECWDGR